jgi:hypothetical protein
VILMCRADTCADARAVRQEDPKATLMAAIAMLEGQGARPAAAQVRALSSHNDAFGVFPQKIGVFRSSSWYLQAHRSLLAARPPARESNRHPFQDIDSVGSDTSTNRYPNNGTGISKRIVPTVRRLCGGEGS